MLRRRLTSAVLLLCVVSLAWRFYNEARVIVAQRATAWTEDHSADCGVVLTGGPSRVREGFDLLAQGRIRKLILSGVHPNAQLREIFPQWPFYPSLREENVILERRSKTTYGNVQQTLPLLEALYCRDFVLVTSRLHMYRALQTFRGSGSDRWTIYPHAVVFKNYAISFPDLAVETGKSLFYSLFAY